MVRYLTPATLGAVPTRSNTIMCSAKPFSAHTSRSDRQTLAIPVRYIWKNTPSIIMVKGELEKEKFLSSSLKFCNTFINLGLGKTACANFTASATFETPACSQLILI